MPSRTPEERARDEQRVERALLGELLPPHDRRIHCKAVGVKFANPDGSSRQQAIDRMSQFDFLELVHQPDDDFDHNCIAIFATVPMFPTAPWPRDCACWSADELQDRGYAPGVKLLRIQIGNLPAELAAELAPAIDAGEKWEAIATRVAGFPTIGVGLLLFRLT